MSEEKLRQKAAPPSFKALSRMSSSPTDSLRFRPAKFRKFQSAVAHELFSDVRKVLLKWAGDEFQSAVAHELFSDT